MLHFRSPPSTISQFPVNGPPPQVPQQDPYGERHTGLQNLLYPIPWKFIFPFRVRGKGAPSMFPKRVPTERNTPSPEPLVYPFMSARVPQKEALLQNGEKTQGHRSRSPTQTEGLHTVGCGLVPQGDRKRHCYLYPSAMQPLARYLPPWLG